jgi:predicted nucleic acid-binding protein
MYFRINTPPEGPPSAPPVRFTGHVRSDQLVDLARILARFEPFRSGTTVVHATLILDANVVIADLIWLCQRRKKNEARSTLLELIECSTVKAYAPTFLTQEIENHFTSLEAERGILPAEARQAWQRFQPRITFVDVGGPDASFPGVTDPKDVPYVRLQRQLSLPIVTEDSHLACMGATVIQIQLFAPLRTYSRQRAVEYQIKIAGLGAVFAASLAAKLAIDGTKAASAAIGNLPKPVQVLGAIGLIAAFVHPSSRRWIFDKLDRAMEVGGQVTAEFYKVLMPIVEEHYAAKRLADDGLAAVVALLTQAGIAPQRVLGQPEAAPQKPRKARKPRARRKSNPTAAAIA